MSIEKINFKEKEIAAMYSIPLKTLRKCRKQQEFGTDVCFTAPNSHIVLYNKVQLCVVLERANHLRRLGSVSSLLVQSGRPLDGKPP